MDLHPLVVVMMVTGTRDHRRTARVRRIHKYKNGALRFFNQN